jgi:hypothetical protein
MLKSPLRPLHPANHIPILSVRFRSRKRQDRTTGPEKESSQNRAGGDSEGQRFRTFILTLDI